MSANEKTSGQVLPYSTGAKRVKDSQQSGGHTEAPGDVPEALLKELASGLPLEKADLLHRLASYQRRLNSPWMTIKEAADYLHVSVSQLKKWRGMRILVPYQAKGLASPRFRRDQLDKLLQQNPLLK